jgi:phosphohistidine phosphatase SixA
MKPLPQQIILVRHGDYRDGPSSPLTPLGRDQVAQLARKLKDSVQGKTITIRTSPVGRVFDSAIIIHEILDCEEPRTFTELDTRNSSLWTENVSIILGALENYRTDTVILVGHSELLEHFPNIIGERIGCTFGSTEHPKGTALVINTQLKTMTFVSHEG